MTRAERFTNKAEKALYSGRSLTVTFWSNGEQVTVTGRVEYVSRRDHKVLITDADHVTHEVHTLTV